MRNAVTTSGPCSLAPVAGGSGTRRNNGIETTIIAAVFPPFFTGYAAAGMAPGGGGSDDCTVPTPQITGSYNIEKSLSQTADFGGEWRGAELPDR